MKHLHYSWVMVIMAPVILATHALQFYSFGIFLRPITTEFNWARGALSASLSITMLASGLLSILAGRLSDKYGPRLLVTANGLLTGIAFVLLSQISSLWHVYLIWGLLMSTAGSCAFIPITSTIPRWFTRRRGIAIGITVAGFGLGGVIAPLLAQWLISSYGWRQAYIILGIMVFIIVTPLAQFMKHSPQRTGLKPYGENETVEDEQPVASAAEGLSFTRAIRTGRFWIFGLILACFFFTLQVIIVHIAPHAVDIGISATIAASILSIIAGISIIGRLSIGFISDRLGTRRALVACLATVTLTVIWLIFSREAWMFYLFALPFGIAYGGVVPLQNLIPAELFGLKSLGIMLGSIFFFGTLGGAVGPPLAGYIFDVTGSYNSAFLICIVLCILAISLSLLLLRSKVEEVQYASYQ